MTEKILTPIQRNENDVAMELLAIHMTRESVPVKEIGNVFAQYYSLASLLRTRNPETLKTLLPDNLKGKL